jgi:hypothetical protein
MLATRSVKLDVSLSGEQASKGVLRFGQQPFSFYFNLISYPASGEGLVRFTRYNLLYGYCRY